MKRRGLNAKRWKRARRLAIERAGGRCERCGAGGPLECHHIRPLSKGGSHYSQENIEALCPDCHRAAHARPLLPPHE